MKLQKLHLELRQRAYWSLDWLKGGKVRAHHNDIKFILENYGSEASEKRRESHLLNLLDHAVTYTDFYAPFKSYKSLQDFPVTNKSILRNNFEAIQSHKLKNQKRFEMTTSGSSGTPFTTVQNVGKKMRNTADTIYFKKKAGFEIGHRLYYIRKWFEMHRRNPIATKMRNIVMVNVTDFTDAYLQQLVQNLNSDTSTKVILAYSSALRDLCKYLERTDAKPIRTKVECIIAMAEGLNDYTRETLKKYFDAPVLLRYSNMENGILSLQLSEKNNHLQINWASYFVEILDLEKDIPVAPGEVGRVVITDLFNYAMPFIRYDTGDLATMVHDDIFNTAPAFGHVHGRRMDAIYDTQGNICSNFIVFHLEEYPEIRQFQFIQQGAKSYQLKLNLTSAFDKTGEVTKMFKSYLGEDARIKITYENKIPQLSSGKRRLVINNYKSL